MTTYSPLSGSPDLSKTENNLLSSPPVPEQAVVAPAKPATKSKPRKRVNTAEKRHQHNAIERQRRETLNGKFLSLARLLPSLATHRRPSKSAIVNGSISHLNYQRNQRLLAAKLLRKLCAEHDTLLNECNEWRRANGYAPKDTPTAWTEEVDEVCTVEKEIFGNFQSFDEGDGDDDDAEMTTEPAPKAPASSTFGIVNGLITPRSSTAVSIDGAAQAAQAMFGNMPVVEPRAVNDNPLAGLWSNDFAFNMINAQPSLGFPSFMPESTVDPSSTTGSPANSQVGAVVTPPTTNPASMVFDHTPSPHSSHSFEDVKPAMQVPTFNAAQMMYLQQQAQIRRQQQHVTEPDWSRVPNMFSVPSQAPNGFNMSSEDLAQQLLATMFPNNNATPDQVQQWRKAALGQVNPQSRQIPQPQPQPTGNMGMRNNMGLTLGADGLWPHNQNATVEGF